MDKQNLSQAQKRNLNLRQKRSSADLFGKNTILIAGSVLFRELHGKTQWFLVKQQSEDKWELPKVIVRKGESSVRAVLRIMGEKGGMTTKVLEEAGRLNSVTKSDNKTQSQKQLYYLMVLKSGSKEAFGFGEYLWLEYLQAYKKINSKKEKTMLKGGRDILKKWKKLRQGKKAE